MNRAEERALEAYPYSKGKAVVSGFGTIEFGQHHDERVGYVEGYHQAEKDLALTIEDIEKIHTFLYAIKHNKQGVFTFTRLSDEQYQEVLNRFNKQKNSNIKI